jgi:tetratricopeptide (TPR) repeat protein
MPLSAGTRFDRYEILGPLGSGGMGEVYVAHDPRLGRKVALKLLPDRYTDDADRVRRFEQEARAASALSHPCIMAVHDFGRAGNVHFTAAEYVEGQTLREHLKAGRLPLDKALDVAIQTASALGAAHDAGIVHRDVKPENVMVRPDGYVKVLDFGLAKLTEREAVPGEDDHLSTLPGMVMGTPHYMSPEQARGLRVDARTDVFSLGVVLYEMVTGQPPFQGPTTTDVLVGILDRPPTPLGQLAASTPPELVRIVSKALEKDRAARYQSVKDMAADLRRLKQQLEVEAELQRLAPEGRRAAAAGDSSPEQPTVLRPGGTAGPFPAPPTSPPAGVTAPGPAVTLTGRARRRRGALLAVGGLLVAALAAGVYVLRRSSQPILTDKDVILLTDFVNSTGDPVFDGTLKQGLAVQLQQSPFLSLLPDSRVRDTLRLMGRPADAKVTAEIGREICQRQGLKAYITGSIAQLGSHYVVALEAVNGQTAEVVAREQVEAEAKEKVLKALGAAATSLRQKLGESLGSIQKFDAPLEVTTSSLEALKAVSVGLEQLNRGRWLPAIPFLERAVELDPRCAYAYVGLAVAHGNSGQPGPAARYMEKAFALKDRVSELERLRISFFFHSFVTGELDRGVDVLEVYKRTYPRDARAPANLADALARLGQFQRAADEARDAVRLDPKEVAARGNLAWALLRLGRYAEAKEVTEKAIADGFDIVDLRGFLFAIAFATGDEAGQQAQVDWAKGQPDEYAALDWQAAVASFRGEWRRSDELARQAVYLASRGGAREPAAQFAADAALRAAAFGKAAAARAWAARALTLARTPVSLPRAGLALAVGGDAAGAEAIAEELAKGWPKDTVIAGLWLPALRGAIEEQRGRPAAAVDATRAASRYEAAAEFWPQYVRGQAHLAARAGSEAALEFRKILEQRGEGPLSVLHPLARLGLGRALALSGDRAGSAEAYRSFLASFAEADSDLPAVAAARRELRALGTPAP